jgi:hypothetical protein
VRVHRGAPGLLLLLLLALSCAAEDEPVAPPTRARQLVACDPLAFGPVPLALGYVHTLGQAPDGTFYVVAGPPALQDDRLFVSEGETLVRREILGKAHSETGGDSSFFGPASWESWISFRDGEGVSRLVYRIDDNRLHKLALVRDDAGTFYSELGPEKVELALRKANVLANYRVRSQPVQSYLMFLASAANGASIALVYPQDDARLDDFRLFYGTAGALDEQPVVSGSSSGGSSTTIRFTIDSEDYVVEFASPNAQFPVTSSLGTPGGQFALSVAPFGTPIPAGTSLRCLD